MRGALQHVQVSGMVGFNSPGRILCARYAGSLEFGPSAVLGQRFGCSGSHTTIGLLFAGREGARNPESCFRVVHSCSYKAVSAVTCSIICSALSVSPHPALTMTSLDICNEVA